MLAKGTVAVRPGTVTSVAVLGGSGRPRELFAFGDATGSRAAPAGGIRTGAGGTATPTGTRLAETGAGGAAGDVASLSRQVLALAPLVLLVALVAVATAMWRRGSA